MAKGSTYAINGATSRQFQRMANYGHILNWNSSFPLSALDGSVDVTSALQTAVNAIRSAGTSTIRPVLILPKGIYKLSNTIDANQVALWAPDGAEFNGQSVGTGKGLVKWTLGSDIQWLPHNAPCAKGIWFKGRDTVANTPTYTAGAYGVETGVSWAKFEDCHFTNFDKPVKYGAYDYCHTWMRCHFVSCNYGLHWPKLQTSSGERMAWESCNFSNNNFGFYFNHNVDSNADGIGDATSGGGSFMVSKCSIDYNITKHGTIVGPGSSPADHNWAVMMTDCHLETLISTSGSATRISNGGVLVAKGNTFYDDYGSPIDNSFYARGELEGNRFSIAGSSNIYCTGSGTVLSDDTNTQRYGGAFFLSANVIQYEQPRGQRGVSSQSAAYTITLRDGNQILLHPSADTTARTWTIPANSSVAFPIGTELHFINQNGAGSLTIAITTDTMRLSGAGTTGSRTLAANGTAVAKKITTTEWIISGTGLT